MTVVNVKDSVVKAGKAAEGATGEQNVEDVNRLIKQRQVKAEELRAAGQNPYRNDFKPTHATAEVLARFATDTAQERSEGEPLSDETFAIAGRIVEHRSFGKAAFVKLADRSGRMQIYIRKDKVGADAFGIFKKSEPYDFLGVKGKAFYTKTGELTLLADEVVVLTKALRPPPEKWKGLRDKETRYRQRYVDLVANPEVAEVFRKRTKIIQFMRRYFDERDFLEVETPILHTILGGAAAKPFRTHHNALNMPLYMRIAPELFLKRLVVGGFERVYEIGRNFRNEGLSRQHNPEFTMLEFYHGYATYEDLIELTEDLLSKLTDKICGTTQIVYQGQAIDMTPPWPRMSVKDCLVHAGQVKGLSPTLTPEIVNDSSALMQWCQDSGLAKLGDQLGDRYRAITKGHEQLADNELARQFHGKRLGVLFEELGEQYLPQEKPVFVVDYPAAISPLSRRKDNDPDFVDRFELFIAGREMANAFSELNDPRDQRERFEKQLEERNRGDEEAMEYDEDYCRALEYGMPPAAGEGIGIDRLVMLLCDQSSIRDVILFPHMRPEGK